MKLPEFAAKEVFYKVVGRPEQIRTSSGFLHKGKCPICKDKKKRMYLKKYPKMYLVYCHNCGYSKSLQRFLKDNFPEEYSSIRPYIMKALADRSYFEDASAIEIEKVAPRIKDTLLHKHITRIGFYITCPQHGLPDEESYRHRCIKYLEDRKIPKDVYEDFICINRGDLAGYIGIPSYDENKSNLIHIQGRKVDNTKLNINLPKYMFVKDLEHDIEFEKPIWGMWRVDASNPVIICEGTLDACAFRNGVSTCGATISESFIQEIIKKYPNRIWCVDNFWLDKAGRDLTNRLLNTYDEKCFVIPEEITDCKDANDLIVKRFIDMEYIPEDFINNNIIAGRMGTIQRGLVFHASVHPDSGL
jgi:hypothetical protein